MIWGKPSVKTLPAMSVASFLLAAAISGAVAFAALAQPPSAGLQPAPVRPQTPHSDPIIKAAHWHDIHLNVTNVTANLAYYPKHFAATATTWNGQPALWTQRSWMLFDKVKTAPDKRLISAIWHIGWGSENPKTDYPRQLALGAVFFQPLTDISTLTVREPDTFYFMYVQGPDRQLIEMNTANQHQFDHMHIVSADPVATAEWYITMFGLTGKDPAAPINPNVRFGKDGLQLGPSASLLFDNVNLIIFPQQYVQKGFPADWVGVDRLQSTRGRVDDHFTVSVPDVKAALAACEAHQVKVTSSIRSRFGGKVKSFFIEGPDTMAIEIMEDHTGHPPETAPIWPA